MLFSTRKSYNTGMPDSKYSPLCFTINFLLAGLLASFILIGLPILAFSGGPYWQDYCNQAALTPTPSTTNPSKLALSPDTSNSTLTTDTTGPSNLTILRSPCGNTPATARAAGCIFEPNSFVWNHPRCHNAELSASFLALRKWSWFEDEEHTRELSLEDVMTSEYDMVVVTMEYHVQHCLLMWKLLHRQALGPWGKFGVDSYVGNLKHTEHCAGMLAVGLGVEGEVMGMHGMHGEEGKMEGGEGNGWGLAEWNTQIRIKYPDCGVE